MATGHVNRSIETNTANFLSISVQILNRCVYIQHGKFVKSVYIKMHMQQITRNNLTLTFIPCSVLILASDWLTTVNYGAVSHVWRLQREI